MVDDNKSAGRAVEVEPSGAAWAAPLARLDASWQALEARLCAMVLVVEIASMTLWVLLRGLATETEAGGTAAGALCRSFVAMGVLGLVANALTRARPVRIQRVVVTSAIVLGFMAGRPLGHVGLVWSSNTLNWLQNASTLMLIGGLRGLVTRLTLWVALLGASLATSRGKHIQVDVLLRYIPAKLRLPVAIAGWLAAAVMCSCAVVGFIDYISIAQFRAPAEKPCPDDANKQCDTTSGEKLKVVGHGISGDAFLLGRQLSLDVRSIPRVLVGSPYDQWMTADAWNTWLDSADWDAHFDKVAVDALRADSATTPTRMPAVTVPGTGEDVRGLLSRELNFVFPFGLSVIAIKFLLRILRAIGGRVSVDPEAAHAEEDLAHAKDEVAA
jgi:TRAP-type C4-dicarboxylate transport system permease small subunit